MACGCFGLASLLCCFSECTKLLLLAGLCLISYEGRERDSSREATDICIYPVDSVLLYSNNTSPPTCLSPLPPHLSTPLFGPMFDSAAPRRLLDPEERSRETVCQKHLDRDVLRVITHAWPLNGHVCYPHNNASRAAKFFIAPAALVVAPCQTQTHTHVLPTAESTGHPPADGSKEDEGRHKQAWKTSPPLIKH